MQLTGPGGVTALDLLARDGALFHRLGTSAWARGAPPRVPLELMARALLGLPWRDARAVCDRALASAELPSAEGALEVTWDARDGALRELGVRGATGERARVRVGELRAQEGLRWPATVLFWQRAPAVLVTLALENVRSAPSLPEATFAPAGLPP